MFEAFWISYCRILTYFKLLIYWGMYLYQMSWITHDGPPCRNVPEDNGTGPHLSMIANVDIAQELGVCADEDMIAHTGMAYLAWLTGWPAISQGDTMKNGNVIADNRGLSDYRSVAVIDKNMVANLGTGVDLNFGKELAAISYDGGTKAPVMLVEPVADPVPAESVKAGVGKNDFPRTASRGINLLNVFCCLIHFDHCFQACAAILTLPATV